MKLEFANIKLTEERYFMSPGVTKKLVMYDIVSRVYIQYIHGVTVIRIQDLNGLILTLITSQEKGDKVNEVFRNIICIVYFKRYRIKCVIFYVFILIVL